MKENEIFLGNIKGPEGELIVDLEISDTSENAIANKEVKRYVDEMVGYINQSLAEIVDGLPEEENTEEE